MHNMIGHTETGQTSIIVILKAPKICMSQHFWQELFYKNHLFLQNKAIQSVVKECLCVN